MNKTLSLSEIDPRGYLFPDHRALIAALADPRLRSATFADLAEMDLGDEAPKEAAELADYRREIQTVRWLIEPGTCPEAAEFLAGFEDQFARWGNSILPDFGFTQKGGKPHEGHKALSGFDLLHTAFTPHELLAMKAMAQEPRLALEPNHGDHQLNFVAMVLAMNRAKRAPQTKDCYVNELYGPVDPRMMEGKPITGYFPHIIDGAHEMEPYAGDDVSQLFPTRLVAHQKRMGWAGLSGINRQRYAAGMAESVHRGEPIDSKLYSILDGDPLLSPSLLPYAFFNDVRPGFYVGRPDVLRVDDRFRVAAGGRRAI